jgi:serine/threonine-protein kinase
MPPGNDQQDGSPLDRTQVQAVAEVAGVHEGARLGQYRLLEQVGSGGMGQVFKAVHPTMDRVVAVKVMAPHLVQDARARARFQREVRSAARLTHPNIVLAYDAAQEGELCFLVMEYVEGKNAAALLHACGLPPVPVACEVIRQAALGLEHAAEQQMVHRDIKPSNLVVAPRRAGGPPAGWPADPVVKILDFGLARLVAPEGADGSAPPATPLTREGCVVGTPEFMSPEQACNNRGADVRSDIYSLGCTFYCLLTGHPPFCGGSLLEVMVQHLQQPPDPVGRRRPDVAPGVAAVLERMLAKRPEDRYQTPGEVAEALRPWAAAGATRDGPVVVAPAPPVPTHALSPTSEERAPDDPATQVLPAGAAPILPRPAPRAPAPTGGGLARGVLGCLGLGLLLVGSMVVGLVYLQRPPAAPPDVPLDEPRTVAGVGLVMVPFPAGPFQPSYAPAGTRLEIPHRFEMSTTEVTREQFQQFVRAKGYKAVSGRAFPPPADPATPVVGVTWEDAVQFCNWLSEQDNRPPCYELQAGPGDKWACRFEADGYRLPTEAEWEYAARAGATTVYPEPAGELLRHGWFRENARGRPQPVGTRRPNDRGLHDVWGNAWEWCWDWYAPSPGPLPEPSGPRTGAERVARGGGWNDPAPQRPGATRKGVDPEAGADDLGFRVARTVPAP